MKQSEADIRANAPIHIFTINEKEFKVSLLPMSKADAWLEKSDAVADMEKGVASAGTDLVAQRKAKREFSQAVLDSLCEYAPALDNETVREGITGTQLAKAFHDLRALTCPFDQTQLLYLADVKMMTASIPSIIPMTVIEKAFGSQKQEPS